MKIFDKIKDKTDGEKLKYLYRVVELLRLEHNQKGADYNSGLLTSSEWEAYVANSFEPRFKTVHTHISDVKSRYPFATDEKEQMEQMKKIKTEGKEATHLDSDIDITTIEP